MADKARLTAFLNLRDPWYISRIDLNVGKEEVRGMRPTTTLMSPFPVP